MSLILVAEDDDDVRDYLVCRLQRLEHEVISTGDGGAALEALRSRRPDLVVSDWVMPGMTGVELCAAIRATPGMENLPVLIVTARAGERDRAEALAAGASDVITKPFVPLELASRVAELLAAV